MLVSGIASLVYGHEELIFVRGLLERSRDREAVSSEGQRAEKLDPWGEIRVEGVSYTYPSSSAPAVQGVSFVLEAKESLVIVGPNGSGKTTLLYLLLGLARPDQGRVLVGGREPLSNVATFGGRVAFVSQRPFEPPEATIAAALGAFDPDAPRERLIQALRDVDLWEALRARARSDEEVLSRALSSLSRGQARRVMIARALVRDADLLVLDEPEAHLDASSVAELGALLGRLAKERRVIAAIHDPGLQSFAPKILRLT